LCRFSVITNTGYLHTKIILTQFFEFVFSGHRYAAVIDSHVFVVNLLLQFVCVVAFCIYFF